MWFSEGENSYYGKEEPFTRLYKPGIFSFNASIYSFWWPFIFISCSLPCKKVRRLALSPAGSLLNESSLPALSMIICSVGESLLLLRRNRPGLQIHQRTQRPPGIFVFGHLDRDLSHGDGTLDADGYVVGIIGYPHGHLLPSLEHGTMD